MARKKDMAPNGANGAATGGQVVKIGTRSLLACLPSDGGGQIVREEGVTMVAGTPYLADGVSVPDATIFFDDTARRRPDSPGLGEADKVSWRDPATRYECIVMRDRRGFLGGYVGVPAGHPLHGFGEDAVPADLGIEVHGGLVYAAICRDGPTPQGRLRYEMQRICHVSVGEHPITHATGHRVEDAHAWWFGFTCNHVVDLIPGDKDHARRGAALGVHQVYRSDGYVIGEVLRLASQLRTIADGLPVPLREGPPLPPASLDPGRAS